MFLKKISSIISTKKNTVLRAKTFSSNQFNCFSTQKNKFEKFDLSGETVNLSNPNIKKDIIWKSGCENVKIRRIPKDEKISESEFEIEDNALPHFFLQKEENGAQEPTTKIVMAVKKEGPFNQVSYCQDKENPDRYLILNRRDTYARLGHLPTPMFINGFMVYFEGSKPATKKLPFFHTLFHSGYGIDWRNGKVNVNLYRNSILFSQKHRDTQDLMFQVHKFEESSDQQGIISHYSFDQHQIGFGISLKYFYNLKQEGQFVFFDVEVQDKEKNEERNEIDKPKEQQIKRVLAFDLESVAVMKHERKPLWENSDVHLGLSTYLMEQNDKEEFLKSMEKNKKVGTE